MPPLPPGWITGTFFYQDALLSLRALRLIHNSTAQVLTKTKRRDHISPVLATLHQLPMKSRVELKILLPTYKAVHGLPPSYIADLIGPYQPSRMLHFFDSGTTNFQM